MAADYALLEQAIAIISSVRGLYMDPDALADDVILLKYGFSGWRSFHFQHRRGQQSRAGMRIVYMPLDTGIRVKGFANRHLPSDIYQRLAQLQ